MNEEFITNGLDGDRFLKADKLVRRFRSQIRHEIEQTLDSLIENHEQLFEADADLDYEAFGTDNNRTLTTIRVETELAQEHDEYGTRLLNIGVEWVEPEEQGFQEFSDGALCYVLYKIQRGDETRFERVKDTTNDSERWEMIRFGDEQWPYTRKEAPGIVYIPIASGSELSDGLQQLSQHFSEVYASELETE